MVCFTPLLFLPVYLYVNVGPWGLLAAAWPAPLHIHHFAGSTSRRLAASPLHPSCPSLPLLAVWMNVSSLSPWLSDFRTVRFSVSSGFLFFNCCPSFGCTRRPSVSTYTSISAGSPKCRFFLQNDESHSPTETRDLDPSYTSALTKDLICPIFQKESKTFPRQSNNSEIQQL